MSTASPCRQWSRGGFSRPMRRSRASCRMCVKLWLSVRCTGKARESSSVFPALLQPCFHAIRPR